MTSCWPLLFKAEEETMRPDLSPNYLGLSPELIHKRSARLSEWRNCASQLSLDPKQAPVTLVWPGASPYGAQVLGREGGC